MAVCTVGSRVRCDRKVFMVTLYQTPHPLFSRPLAPRPSPAPGQGKESKWISPIFFIFGFSNLVFCILGVLRFPPFFPRAAKRFFCSPCLFPAFSLAFTVFSAFLSRLDWIILASSPQTVNYIKERLKRQGQQNLCIFKHCRVFSKYFSFPKGTSLSI